MHKINPLKYWCYGPTLDELKLNVRTTYQAKINAWNRLISVPFERQNEIDYVNAQDKYLLAVDKLTYFWRLAIGRRDYLAPKTYDVKTNTVTYL